MAKKSDLETGLKGKIVSDRTLTSEDEAREEFWKPTAGVRSATSEQQNIPNELDISLLEPDPDQPRKCFNKQKLEELEASIRERGIEVPLSVRPTGDGKYKIISGERRWRCASNIGLQAVPVIIKSLNDKEAFIDALTDNIQREDLHYLDEAESFQKMIDRAYVKDQNELAGKLKKSLGYVSKKMAILSLPQKVKDLIYASEAISYSHAVLLATIDEEEKAYHLAQKIIKDNLPTRKLEQMISSAANLQPHLRRPKSSFHPIKIEPVTHGFNMTIKYRKDRPEDVVKIIATFEDKIAELRKYLNEKDIQREEVKKT